MGTTIRRLGAALSHGRRWLALAAALVALGCLAALWLARPRPPAASVGQLYMVEDTTLVALQGDVQLQPRGGSGFAPLEGARGLAVGDRVRTGTDGYAWILFADGSSASLGPDTEIALLGGEPDAASGATTVALEHARGTLWRAAAARGTTPPALVVNSPAGLLMARGTAFTVAVAPDGTVSLTAGEGTVEAHTASGDVDLPAGFTSRIALGQAPTVPVPAAVPPVTLRVAIQGPVSVLLTDARGRSTGYPPAAEAYVSQIPSVRLGRGERGTQVFTIPAPTERYTVTVQGQAAGQAVVEVSAVRS